MRETQDIGIEALTDLALNLRWSWNRSTDELWAQLEPELWALTHNPWAVLRRFPQAEFRTSWGDRTTDTW